MGDDIEDKERRELGSAPPAAAAAAHGPERAGGRSSGPVRVREGVRGARSEARAQAGRHGGLRTGQRERGVARRAARGLARAAERPAACGPARPGLYAWAGPSGGSERASSSLATCGGSGVSAP